MRKRLVKRMYKNRESEKRKADKRKRKMTDGKGEFEI